jgi:hypothetical protein
LVGNSEEKRPFARPRLRWNDNLRIKPQVPGYEDVKLIHLAQDRDQWMVLVNTALNFRVP